MCAPTWTDILSRVYRLVLSSTGSFYVAVTSLVLSQGTSYGTWLDTVAVGLDVILVLLLCVEIVADVIRNGRDDQFLRDRAVSFLLVGIFAFALGARYSAGIEQQAAPGVHQLVIVVRTILLLIPSLTRSRRLSGFVTDIVLHPAQTVALSFLFIILVGTTVLMLPFTVPDGNPLGLVDALFTATSAVCVTGLIVVDTATAFSVWGQIVIMVLIQMGGIGIMVLALFTFTLRRQAVSVESHALLSYMLNESRMNELSSSLRRIVVITFGIEAVGATLLFAMLGDATGTVPRRVLFAAFHAVSAFCNAGFALFTTSLEQFRDHVGVNLVVIALIVGGGISFGVLTNLFQHIRTRLVNRVVQTRIRVTPLSVNTLAVLTGTGIMLVAAFFLFYALEHSRSMVDVPTGKQYLAALFQSVTLRTAGFNTVPTNDLATGTYIMFMVFMFVGGASGSTAGGIKINNAAAIVAHVRAIRRNQAQTLLFGHAISDRQITTAFTVLLFGFSAVVGATFILTLTETHALIKVIFEAVSAFGTVGLSAGITGELSQAGRLVIIVLMFIGRVGPLTLLAAAGRPNRALKIQYPSAELSIG